MHVRAVDLRYERDVWLVGDPGAPALLFRALASPGATTDGVLLLLPRVWSRWMDTYY